MTTTTTAMQQFGSTAGPESASRGGKSAGLVLLYSESYANLQPSYAFTCHEVTIGREPSCAIPLPQNAVSRRHASVRYCDGHWLLRDLGGPNGTIADGRFITEVELEHTQEIRIGDNVFKYVASGAEDYMPYRLDGVMLANARRHATQLTELCGGAVIDRFGVDLERFAQSGLSVVIAGETGTGKEVVARELHRLSGRSGPLQAVNCAAIPANLIESELFGYKRGAFSGADRDKLGIVAAANGGTLLLDEIGDMPLEAQAKLLRVIQTREVYPLGATHAHHIDVRFLCATNRDLRALVKEQRFRGDLLSRLDEWSISLPPLRDRKEDIFLLARTLLARHGHGAKQLSFPFMLALLHYDWPYNVRELEACLRRAAAVTDAVVLDPHYLPEPVREAMALYGTRADAEPHAVGSVPPPAMGSVPPPAMAAPPAPRRRAQAPSEDALRQLLAQHRGNVAAVGRELGKERMQVHRWMQRYGIVVDDYRS